MDDDFSISQGNGLGGDGGRRRREEKRAEACEGGSSEQPLSPPPPPLSLKEVVGGRSRRRWGGWMKGGSSKVPSRFSHEKKEGGIFLRTPLPFFSLATSPKYACSCPLTPKDGVGALFSLRAGYVRTTFFLPLPRSPKNGRPICL